MKFSYIWKFQTISTFREFSIFTKFKVWCWFIQWRNIKSHWKSNENFIENLNLNFAFFFVFLGPLIRQENLLIKRLLKGLVKKSKLASYQKFHNWQPPGVMIKIAEEIRCLHDNFPWKIKESWDMVRWVVYAFLLI